MSGDVRFCAGHSRLRARFQQENLSLFRASQDTDTWKAYVDYVDEMVVDGFFSTIHCSLKFLLDATEPRPDITPLFEAHMELQVQETDA